MKENGKIPLSAATQALPEGYARARVDEIEIVAVGTKRFVLVPTSDAAFPAAEPGTHIDVALPSGKIRQYSVLTPDTKGAVVIVVKREARGRGGSAEMHDLMEGSTIGLGPVRNHFPLADSPEPAILVAGGIGITPILAMARHLHQTGKPFRVVYAARSREDMAFCDELAAMPQARLHFDVETGRTLDMEAVVNSLSDGEHIYCCGPVPMLQAYRAATAQLPPERVHWELFESTQNAADEGGFEVECARSRLTLKVPAGRRIIDVLMEAGLHVPMSCEKGICGSCETPVLEGIPDHRDEVLSDEEKAANNTMLVCCGGCLSDRLVLDI